MEGLAPEAITDPAAGGNAREVAAVDLARACVADAKNVSDSVWQAVSSNFSKSEQVELVFLIGYIQMLNVFNSTLQTRYNNEYSG